MATTHMVGLPNAGISKVDFQHPDRSPTEILEDYIGHQQTEYGTGTITKWIVSGTNGVAGNFTAAVGEDGGAITNTTTATSADGSFAQLSGIAFKCDALSGNTPGRAMRFAVRFKTATITSVTQSFGMYITAAGDVVTTPVNGFGFLIVNGVVQYQVKNAGGTTAPTAVGFGTVAINTYYTLEIQMSGSNELTFWVNGIKYVTTSTNVPTGLFISPQHGAKTTSAATKAYTIEKLYAAVEGNRS